jgi:hypothetical protein
VQRGVGDGFANGQFDRSGRGDSEGSQVLAYALPHIRHNLEDSRNDQQ